MYGYVIPLREELKVRDFERYRASYCGLCRCLRKRYGFAARFTVSYDMTFLYCLLSALSEKGTTARCFCPAHPLCRRECVRIDAALEFTADAGLILFYWKLRDAVQDAGFLGGLPARMAALLLKRRYRRAASRQAALDELVRGQLQTLHALEASQSASLDQTADTFARMLEGCAAYHTDARTRRVLEQLLYHVGRTVYLADALDDLREDAKKRRYNPLRYRFPVQNGTLQEEDKRYFLQTVDYSIGMAASALELLELRCNEALLHNILYLGLPAMLKAVSLGVYKRQCKF